LSVTSSAVAGYLFWIDTPAFGLTAGQKGENADPDNDGMANLLEFVLNGNPSVSDPSILPVLNITATNFEFIFNRRDDSVSPETIQTFQYGTDLTNWTSIVIPVASGSVGAATITVTDGTPADIVKISIPKATVAPETKLFGRLQIIK
jgi:outer membrane receptor protein involved in Fe transport